MNTKQQRCIICYRNELPLYPTHDNEDNPVHNVTANGSPSEILTKFYKLAERYLGDNHWGRQVGNGVARLLLKNFIDAGMICCGSCQKILKSFCDLYHQLKYIELQLNWKVKLLEDIMTTAQNDHERVMGFREGSDLLEIEGFSSSEMTDFIVDFNANLVEKCSKKIQLSFPKLVLEQLKSQVGNMLENLITICTDSEGLDTSPSIYNDKEVETATGEVDGVYQNPNLGTDSSSNHILECDLEQDENSKNLPSPSTELSFERLDYDVDGEKEIENSATSNETTALLNLPQHGRDDLNEPSSSTEFPTNQEYISNKKDNETFPAPINSAGRSLRTIHRCISCSRTFATNQRLTQHQNSDLCNETSGSVQQKREDDDELGSEVEATTTDTSDTSDGDEDDMSNFVEEESESHDHMERQEKVGSTSQRQVADAVAVKIKLEAGCTDKGRKTFPCPRCHKPFSTRAHLEDHVTLYHPPEWMARLGDTEPPPKRFHFRYKCPDCNRLFTLLHSMLLHRTETHSPNTAKASNRKIAPTISVQILSFQKKPASNIKSGKSKDFEIFASLQVPENVYLCEVPNCKEPFYSPDELKRHSKVHGEFTCNFCNKVELYAPTLAEHELKHCKVKSEKSPKKQVEKCWEYKSYVCPRCKAKFSGKEKYVLHHLEEHMELAVNSNACAICKTHSFRQGPFYQSWVLNYTSNGLFLHYKLQHDRGTKDSESLIKCHVEDCGAYFLRQGQLTFHLRLKHFADDIQIRASKKTAFKCQDCAKSFDSGDKLRHHRLTKHVKSEDHISCTKDNCNAKFETKEEFDRHNRVIHHPTKSVKQCPKCGKSFYREPNLIGHMKWHKRMEDIEAGLVKPKEQVDHVCELCGKRFNSKKGLEIHTLSHSGPASWKFMCTVCSKKCIFMQKLDEHMRTHTKSKPFVCEICGEKYAHRHNFRNHMKSKHGVVVGSGKKTLESGKTDLQSNPLSNEKKRKRNNDDNDDDY